MYNIMINNTIIRPLFHIHKLCIRNYRPLYYRGKYSFSQNYYPKHISQQLFRISSKVQTDNIKQDYSQLVQNYLQFTQESFFRYVQQKQVDPHLLLMFLSTLQKEQETKKFIPFLYPHVNYFDKKQLLLIFQKILAFKPLKKPKIPYPKPLQEVQSLLVILSVLYPCDSLLNWLQYVPVYEGTNLYVLCMGYFSVLQKLSPQNKYKQKNLLKKCGQRIKVLAQPQQTQIKIGIVLLALQLNYEQALTLLLSFQFNILELQPHKLCLLLINLKKYRKNYTNEEEIQSKLNKLQNEIIKELNTLKLQQILKIQLYLQLWKIVYHQPLEGPWKKLVNQLCKIPTMPSFQKSLQNLTEQQVIIILQAMHKHKINQEKTLRKLLTCFSQKLQTIDKQLLIRLVKVLVTYVRQCEGYLISVRKIIESRKFQLTMNEVKELNETFERVRILFPKTL